MDARTESIDCQTEIRKGMALRLRWVATRVRNYLAGASVSRSDLNLVQGQSYYVTVQARNTSGLWSVNGVSNRVIGGESRVYLPAISRP